MAGADFDDFLEQQRAQRWDGGTEAKPHEDEDECNNEEEEEQDEDGERADSVGHERRARIEMDAEDDERCLKSHMEVI
jgi:hypothetical protein